MCGTDFQHEMGEVDVTMYSSIEELKRKRKCVRECGIVAVNVEFIEWIDKGLPYSQRGEKLTESDGNYEKGIDE